MHESFKLSRAGSGIMPASCNSNSAFPKTEVSELLRSWRFSRCSAPVRRRARWQKQIVPRADPLGQIHTLRHSGELDSPARLRYTSDG